MHFVKFETARIQDCLDFIEAKGLHCCYGKDGMRHEVRVKATGGGAVRFAGQQQGCHKGYLLTDVADYNLVTPSLGSLQMSLV
jgi:pantothenate kinase